MTHKGVLLFCVCLAAVSDALFNQLIKDDFVLVLSCYAGFEARVVAGRASRRVSAPSVRPGKTSSSCLRCRDKIACSSSGEISEQ